MDVEIDEATERFLKTARGDLQRYLGIAGTVERIDVEGLNPAGVRLVARVRVARRTVELEGHGANLVEAYSAIIAAQPERVLAASFEQVLEPRR